LLDSKLIASCTDDLIAKLDFRDPEPAIIDLSPKDGLVPTLQESKVECLVTDKVIFYTSQTLVLIFGVGCLLVLLSIALSGQISGVYVSD
jgi:hypothetical protein